MKKILLVSMLCNVTDLLKKAEPDLNGKIVTYIPTAAIAEEIEGMAEAAKGKLYIGESAGAIAACPDIGYSAEMDVPGKAPELTDYTGMGLVDFYVVPHLGHPEMGPAANAIIERYSLKLGLKVIDDHQAILIEGDKVSILRE